MAPQMSHGPLSIEDIEEERVQKSGGLGFYPLPHYYRPRAAPTLLSTVRPGNWLLDSAGSSAGSPWFSLTPEQALFQQTVTPPKWQLGDLGDLIGYARDRGLEGQRKTLNGEQVDFDDYTTPHIHGACFDSYLCN